MTTYLRTAARHLGEKRGPVDRVRPRFGRRQVQRLTLSVSDLRLSLAAHQLVENRCTHVDAPGSRAPLALVSDQREFRQSLNLSIDLGVREDAADRRPRRFRRGRSDRLASGLSGHPNRFWRYASLDHIHDVKLAALGLRDALNHLRRQQCDVHDADRRHADGAKRNNHLLLPPGAGFVAVAPEDHVASAQRREITLLDCVRAASVAVVTAPGKHASALSALRGPSNSHTGPSGEAASLSRL